MQAVETDFYAAAAWFQSGRGPRYLQLYHHISEAISTGTLTPGTQLPPEREMADLADVSRVTVRKAVAHLVSDGLVQQRQGAGSFVQTPGPKLEQSLSSLTSFTEYMQRRGKSSTSEVLESGLFQPAPDETVALGMSAHERVARVRRLRSADGLAMALEQSSLPADILPNPGAVKTSLYDVLRRADRVPSRAIQRIAAVNLGARDARLLNLAVGTAVLRIDRTGYLPSGRPIEFTRGLYRSDFYDFVSELRREGGT